MKFSLITITYNSEAYLEETIASVLSQEHIDFEYILVDGDSTDGTLDIIRTHAETDPRIRWISEPDDGIADAFNKGIRMASGDIIGILNSDDCYVPGALQIVASAVASHPECDVFHGNMIRFQGDKPLFLLKPSDVEQNIWHEMPLNHPATFVTRRAYQAVGLFDTVLKVAMDYDMILRLYTAGFRFWHIDAVLAQMRYGGASDTEVLAGLGEVYRVSVRQGYSRWKASCWMVLKGVLRGCKLLLRKCGLYSIMRLNPKFHEIGKQGSATIKRSGES
jgi:glycosyltransferase involved in cell wall biosynthesis